MKVLTIVIKFQVQHRCITRIRIAFVIDRFLRTLETITIIIDHRQCRQANRMDGRLRSGMSFSTIEICSLNRIQQFNVFVAICSENCWILFVSVAWSIVVVRPWIGFETKKTTPSLLIIESVWSWCVLSGPITILTHRIRRRPDRSDLREGKKLKTTSVDLRFA